MNRIRFSVVTERYPDLRLAVLGDFCLDRYLEIDPARQEVSIETGLAVHNVVNVRSQAGAAGTILNNLAALGIGDIYPVGFAGEDGEGTELIKALRAQPGVRLDHFFSTPARRTFTYCKPLLLRPGQPPEELNRLDSKNWTPTPPVVEARIVGFIEALADHVQAMILLDQVDLPDTGVITPRVLERIGSLAARKPERLVVADSRRGLSGYPPLCFKMNRIELASLSGSRGHMDLAQVKEAVAALAKRQGQLVVVTLADEGMIGAGPAGETVYVPAFPVRGAIDVVGAGDAVTANLTAALAAGATLEEALELASAAASIVVHQLGTTGVATVGQIEALLFPDPPASL